MTANINLIMGGPSQEYEISLKTGWEMFSHLDKAKYSVRVVVIDKNQNFFYTEYNPDTISKSEIDNIETSSCFNGPISPMDSKEIWNDCDIALLALHGEFGEDGKIQGYLETLKIPYTGSKVFASAAGMEKIATKEIFEQNSIKTPPYSIFYSFNHESELDRIAKKRGFPLFVKCPQSGSSRLLGRAADYAELDKMVKEFIPHTRRVLIESGIDGEEYSCPVLEYPDGSLKALPPILIKSEKEFFDFEAKYSGTASQEIVPAPCSEELTDKIKNIALKAHRVLGCSGVSRTDMIVNGDGVFVLETNTLPGFTTESLLPKSFISLGGTFSELLNILIETELRRDR